MNSAKNKKILITILDILLGILIGLYTSKTFPNLLIVVIILFVLILGLRIGIDWFTITDEEKFYKEFIQDKMDEMQRSNNLQKIAQDKMIKALKEGDFQEYNNYSRISKDLK